MFYVAACLPSPSRASKCYKDTLVQTQWMRSTLKNCGYAPPELCSHLCVQGSALRWLYWIQNKDFFFFFQAWQWLPLQLYLTLNAVLLSLVRSSKLSPESGNRLITHKTLFVILYLNGHFWNVSPWLKLNVHDMLKCHECHCHWVAGASCLQGGEWPNGRCQDNWSDDEWTLPSVDGGARACDVQEPQH